VTHAAPPAGSLLHPQWPWQQENMARWQCNTCYETFTSFEGLKFHFGGTQSMCKPSARQCNTCYATFTSFEGLQFHSSGAQSMCKPSAWGTGYSNLAERVSAHHRIFLAVMPCCPSPHLLGGQDRIFLADSLVLQGHSLVLQGWSSLVQRLQPGKKKERVSAHHRKVIFQMT